MGTRILLRPVAALAAVIAVLAPAAVAAAAEPPKPIHLGLPDGPGIDLGTDPITISAQTGAKNTPANKVPDFTVDLLLIKCGYSIASDGTIWCGVPKQAAPTPAPEPTPTPVPSPQPILGPAPEGGGHGGGRPESDGTGPGSGGTGGTAADTAGGDRSAVGSSPEGDAGDDSGDGSAAGPATAAPVSDDASATVPAAIGPALALPLSDKEVLTLGVTAFALLTLVGSRGLAAGSARSWRRRYPKAADDAEGSVTEVDEAMYEFDPELAGPGDRSRWWRFVSGWVLVDRLSRLVPAGLSLRAPLLARISADGSYLRAVLGAGWVLLPMAGFAAGVWAAHDTGGYPLAPGLVLTSVLICIAVLDAAAGFLGVVGFVVGLFIWGPGDLGFAPSLRSFLGLAALWFAIPLIASTARPLRRTRERTALYTWDRIADGVIAALISGWAVQGAVGGLAGLSGRQSPIDPYADRLALLTIGAVAVRVAVEEAATRFFPERLKVVDTGMLPDSSPVRSLVSALLRTAVFLFVAHPFVGSCWQLWVGGLIFVLPQLLDLVADRLPNSERLFRVIPRGVAMVLFMIVVGILVGRLVQRVISEGPSVVQNGFVLLAIPGLVVSLVCLVGRDGPVPARSWRNELLGVLAVGVSVALVLQG